MALIDLRCEGKLHGQLDPESLTLITAKGDWMYVYDLAATVRERRPVVIRLRAGEYSTSTSRGDRGQQAEVAPAFV